MVLTGVRLGVILSVRIKVGLCFNTRALIILKDLRDHNGKAVKRS